MAIPTLAGLTASTSARAPASASAPAYDVARLYRDYSGKVFHWARRLVRSSSDAEDIVQEVFLTAHRRQQSMDGVQIQSPGPWLLKVTFNVARHVWRKRGHSVPELHREAHSVPSLAPSPLEQLEGRRAVQQFEAALASLDQRSRDIYWLCEIQQLPSAMVAAQTGVHPATLRVRRFRARAQIAQRLALDEDSTIGSAAPARPRGKRSGPIESRADGALRLLSRQPRFID